jgi:hypothetical protein
MSDSQRKRSLVDYERDRTREKRREGCVLCKLPDDVKEQLRSASRKKIPREVVLEWLNKELGFEISINAFQRHAQGRHDYR